MLSVALTPDGRWVLSGSKDRGVQFWDPTTGSTQLMLQGHKNSGIDLDPEPHLIVANLFCDTSYLSGTKPRWKIIRNWQWRHAS